jgi:nucleotide sugar dehydrogenase
VKVCVVGCGYVGLVTALALARAGHRVVGVEGDDVRRKTIAGGTPPFHEPGLPELLAGELEAGRFEVTGEIARAAEAEVVLLAVQTPPEPSGSIDLSYLRNAAADLVPVLAGRPARRVVAVRSTVVPGTVDGTVAPLFADGNTAVASNPEFLREGSAVEDGLHPDRVVVGCRDDHGRELLRRLYEPLGAPVIFTEPATAELAKYTSNALLAALISFSNEIGRIAESLPDVDVEDVLGIVHRDRRLSPVINGETVRPGILAYLKAGCGYGGSCLPKDLSALLAFGRETGQEHPLLEGIRSVNDSQGRRVVDIAERAVGDLGGRRAAVLGLAFKGGTDDVRSSPALRIIDELLERGADVVAYDPLVDAAALPAYAESVAFARSLEEALEGAAVAVVTTNADEFSGLRSAAEGDPGAGPVIVDGRRALDRAAADAAVGRGPALTRAPATP